MHRISFVLILLIVALGSTRTARADEVAPDLEGADLRTKATAELKRLVANLAQNDQKRLTGVYVAFDPNAGDPFAQVACDDDGDYVILLSDAMLRLSANVARAASYDEANNNRKVEEYATFIARSQIPGRRLLPPPPGFFIAEKPAPTYEDRLIEMISFVLARELTHLRAGDLVCPHPTATKEAGDDVWSASEQRKATESARAVYPGRLVERDTEATVRVLEAGLTERGGLALMHFFIQYEVDQRVSVGRFLPTYLAHHPTSAAREGVIKSAAQAHRSPD